MTSQEIIKKQNRQNMKFQVAIEIRAILDKAKESFEKEHGKGSWEEDSMNEEIQDLVFSDAC